MQAPLQQSRPVPHAASHPPPLLEALPPELVLPELLPLPELEPLALPLPLDDDEAPLASSPEPEASSPPEPVVDPPQWEANARAEKAATARDHEDRRVIELSPPCTECTTRAHPCPVKTFGPVRPDPRDTKNRTLAHLATPERDRDLSGRGGVVMAQ